jgi:glycolate oxidase FAD binding subunit
VPLPADASAWRDAIALALSQIFQAQQMLPYESWPQPWQQQVEAACGGQVPLYWVLPNTVQELAAVMSLAHQHRWCVLVAGQGTKLGWGALGRDVELVISTQKLNGLIDHAVEDMTVTVEAGMRFADLQLLLAKHRQWLPLDPMYPAQATLGGILATKDAGSLRHRYGSLRDLCLGLHFVRSDGQTAKAGGRVVKNVAGYDLMKLFAGAHGTLGIVTEMTLRVYPLQSASQTILVTGTATAIDEITHELLQSTLTPVRMDIAVKSQTETLTLLVQFQSLPESVSAQIERVQAMAQARSLTAVILTSDVDSSRDAESSPGDNLDNNPGNNSMLCQVGILSAQAVSSLVALRQIAADHSLIMYGKIHAGSGLGQLYLVGSEAGAEAVLIKWRSQCEQCGGFLSVLEAPRSIKQNLDVWGYSGSALDAMRKLKEHFDPQGLLNPGRFVSGI